MSSPDQAQQQQQQPGVSMDLPVQAIIDVLSNQRNVALNELAKTQAMLNVALAEVERLSQFEPKDSTTAQAANGADNPVKPGVKNAKRR